ncbi:Uu.00g080160.m01.CDS01 [Anthostomella pinea]|uniref:Uu.00g080160.m01.CDS01 n=1 Tax=Anthostomella pinea TaxID=933095 RepID=A0AAI8VKY1_9PEZI|nr:Uu.00g080160.m01.CDS01 [Anthostomella pinea]
MAGWNDLPAEIRLMVLRMATNDKKLSNYTTVCKEWQPVFEKANFRAITLLDDEVSELNNILQGRRRTWLRRVCFHIRLPRYRKKLSREPETEEEQDANNAAFTNSLWHLFEVLAAWDRARVESGPSPGLELELQVYSPSDPKKLTGEALLRDDGENRFFDSDLDLDFDDKASLGGPCGLPEVESVTGFRFLRRNRRSLTPAAFLFIISSLPSLTDIKLEPWHQVDQHGQETLDRESAVHMPFWPATLKKVSIFEHFDAFRRDPEEVQEKCPQLGRNLYRLSLRLEECYIAKFADAWDFFEPFFGQQPSPGVRGWDHLCRLSLTSTFIDEREDGESLNALLLAAGRAARYMPQLRLFELWNAESYGAGVFLYSGISELATLTWKSTWEFRMDDGVKARWRDAARKHAGKDLVVEPEELLVNYRGPMRFIHFKLATRGLILDPTSSTDMMGKAAFPPSVW